MDVFNSLPTEIISEIFSNLAPAELLAISYLSHRLRAISQPLLYSAPSLYFYQDTRVSRPSSAFEKFLHTILTPPGAALASCVQLLTLQWGERRGNNRDSGWPFSFFDDSDAEGPPRSAVALRTLAPNSQLLLLLSRLPKLRVLHVELDNVIPHSFNSFIADLASTLCATPSPPSAVHTLRSITYCPPMLSSGMSASSLLTLLLLPCIDSLEITLRIRDALLPSYGAGCTSTVTNLRLWNDGILATELASILAIPACLKRFACNSPINSLFGHALSPLSDSVIHLELVPLSARPDVHPVGSLRAWKTLRTLRCTLAHLYPYSLSDALPPGIRALEILRGRYIGPVQGQLLSIVALLQRKSEVVPELQRLVLNMNPGKERKAILQACVAARVAFSSQTYGEGGCFYEVPV